MNNEEIIMETNDRTPTKTVIQQVKNEARISQHEAICEERYGQILRRFERLEKQMWFLITSLITGFGVVSYHLIDIMGK